MATQQNNKDNPAKKRQWFYWTGLTSIIFSVTAFTMMLAMGKAGTFIFSQWYQFFIPIPAFFAGQMSGWSSVGREMDLINDEEQKSSTQQWMTLGGIIIGLTVGISLVVIRFSALIATVGISEIVIETLSAIASIAGSVGSFAGLASRIELSFVWPKQNLFTGILSFLTKAASIFNEKRKSIIAGLIAGLGTSLTLWFTGTASLTIIVGVTSFFTGGLAIPFWVTGALFCLGYTGTNASSFDYLSKMQTYYKVILFHDKEAEETIAGRFHEHRATAIGVTLGIIVATAIVITLIVTQPYLIALVGAVAVTIVCTSTLGSFFSHIGTFIDIHCCRKYPHRIAQEHIPTSTMSSAKVMASLGTEVVMINSSVNEDTIAYDSSEKISSNKKQPSFLSNRVISEEPPSAYQGVKYKLGTP